MSAHVRVHACACGCVCVFTGCKVISTYMYMCLCAENIQHNQQSLHPLLVVSHRPKPMTYLSK